MKSWGGPFACSGQSNNHGCTETRPHLHCDGPGKGEWVEYSTKDGRKGIGQVDVHWHYEGCVIDVRVGSSRATCFPELGDQVTVCAGNEDPMRHRWRRAKEFR